jgi:TnpA family transposase
LGSQRSGLLLPRERRGSREGRSTTLARAIGEPGRLSKTLYYLLDYFDDASYRRRVLFRPSRGEKRHNLARVVFHDKKGELSGNATGKGRKTNYSAL